MSHTQRGRDLNREPRWIKGGREALAERFTQYRCGVCGYVYGNLRMGGRSVAPCAQMIYRYAEVKAAIYQAVVDLIDNRLTTTSARVPTLSICGGIPEKIIKPPRGLYLCKECCAFTDDLEPCRNYRRCPMPTRFITGLSPRGYDKVTADKIRNLQRFELEQYNSDYRRICGHVNYAHATGPCGVDLEDVEMPTPPTKRANID